MPGPTADAVGYRFDCVFPFTVHDVADAKFYRIAVSHRGEGSCCAAQLKAKKWNVKFTLGD